MHQLEHITDAELAVSSRPAGRRRARGEPAERLHRRRPRRLLLRLRAASTSPAGWASAQTDLQRRADHPDHAAPGHAGRRRPGRAQHAADGRRAGRHVHRRRAQHREGARDERNRRYGCAEPSASRSSSTWRPARAPVHLQGVHRGRRPGGGLLGVLHDHTPATRTRRGSTRNGGTRAPPTASGTPATTRRRWTCAGALIRSSNTYFLALEDALGSVEKPVRMAQRMGLHFDSPTRAGRRDHRGEPRVVHPRAEATSPLDLASAYGTLAANGTQCDPKPGRAGPRPQRASR